MRNRRALAGAAIAAGAAVAVTGCSEATDAGPRITPPATRPAPAPTSFIAAQRALPLAAYRENAQEAATVKSALDRLIVQCMRQRGFADFTDRALGGPPSTDDSGEPGGPYGLIDAEKAAEHGFHQRLRIIGPDSAAHSNPAWANALPACNENAARQLDNGQAGDGSGLVPRLVKDSEDRTVRDSRVREATARWSSCMRGKGFNYKTPPSRDQWVGRSASMTPTRAEISTAVASASCTSSTNLAGVYFMVLDGYQRQFVTAYSERLTAIRAAIGVRVARARQLTASKAADTPS